MLDVCERVREGEACVVVVVVVVVSATVCFQIIALI